MRKGLATAVAALIAGGCSSQVNLADHVCADPKVGDRVNGTLTMYAYSGVGCIECGTLLLRAGCRPLGMSIGSDNVDATYKRIVGKPLPNRDFVEHRVTFSGRIIETAKGSRPLVSVTALQPVD